MTTIAQSLLAGTTQLASAGIKNARLDVLVLLSDTLQKDKSWILAHPEFVLPATALREINAAFNARAARQPLAYIRNRQAFYGRNFRVTREVLIPRPETESIIDMLKTLKPKTLLDVGTGSGAIAVTTALELPTTHVAACDISHDALKIAAQNAKNLGARVEFFTSNLLAHAAGPYDAIAANLPYVDPTWERSAETSAEPALALFAEDGGLALIKKLLAQAPAKLNPRGHLLLEADPRQHAAIITAAKNDFTQITTEGFALLFQSR